MYFIFFKKNLVTDQGHVKNVNEVIPIWKGINNTAQFNDKYDQSYICKVYVLFGVTHLGSAMLCVLGYYIQILYQLNLSAHLKSLAILPPSQGQHDLKTQFYCHLINLVDAISHVSQLYFYVNWFCPFHVTIGRVWHERVRYASDT